MWITRLYDDNILQEMLEMTEEHYGKAEVSAPDFIKHQYFKNPAGSALIKLAYDNDAQKLAGQYVTIPMLACINGKNVKCILSLNTLTRREYRGQKIFTSLAANMFDECENSEIQFCYGAPNQNSYHGFVSKLGFTDIGRVPLYVKILRPSKLIYAKTKVHVLSSLASLLDPLFRVKKKNCNYTIVPITSDNQNLFDTFWESIKTKYQLIFVRNSNYIQWRYLHMPQKKYQLFMALQENVPVGYIVGRITDVNGMKCGMITDFLVEKGNRKAGLELLNVMLTYFYENSVELAGSLMQKNSEEKSILTSYGFFKCPRFLEPQPFPIILRTFSENNDNIHDFSNWFFTMGDYDAI